MWPARTVEVECDTIDQLREAIEAGADLVMLDNMTPEQVRECVALNERRVLLEVSGGITIENVRGYGDTGVDLISTGSITNSAPVLDIGFDIDVGRGM
jgi:nicotinate-nucleotide pyrophosphorylase (carboxylating)